MKSPPAAGRKPARTAVTAMLMLLIGVLILQSLGYGIGFFLDPASNVGEFASPPVEGDPLTIALVRMVGVGMLGTALLLGLAALLASKEKPAGGFIAIVVGTVYVLAGASSHWAGWTWDAYFYAGSGGLLIALAGAVLWLQRVGTAADRMSRRTGIVE